jgi:CBS domain-containing protein
MMANATTERSTGTSDRRYHSPERRKPVMIQIRTIFKAEVIDAYPQETLAEAARRMRENEVSSLAVVQDDQLLGILTERDLVQALSDGADPHRTQVIDYMTLEPFTTSPEESSGEVAMQMLEHGVRHVPVVVDGKVVGMVSARDLLMLEAMAAAGLR